MTPEQHTLYTIFLFLSLWSLSMWTRRRQERACVVGNRVAAIKETVGFGRLQGPDGEGRSPVEERPRTASALS